MGVSNFWEGGVENRDKRRKDPISLVLEEDILQFVNETLQHSPLHFSDDQLAPLIPKIGNKIEKKVVFLDLFHTVPSIYRLSLLKIMGQVCYFITP